MWTKHRRSPKNQILNNVYPDWFDNDGVISQLNDAPWVNVVDNVGLNLAYHARSGEKFVSPIVYYNIDDDGEITQSGKQSIKRALMALYGQKWSHLWADYATQYNPALSFQSTETRVLTDNATNAGQSIRTPNLANVVTDLSSSTRTPNLSEAITYQSTDTLTTNKTDTRTPNITVTETIDQTIVVDDDEINTLQHGLQTVTTNNSSGTAQHDVYAFNSAIAVPSSIDNSTNSNTGNEVNSGSDITTIAKDTTTDTDASNQSTETGTEQLTTVGTEANAKTGTDTTRTTGTDFTSTTASKTTQSTGTESVSNQSTDNRAVNETITKQGFNQSPTELLSFDREFWLVNYFDIVFDDIDSFLTLAIYPDSPINEYVF